MTGGDSNLVEIDVIECFSTAPISKDDSNFKTFDVITRVQSIVSYDNGVEGILRAKAAYPGVNFRYRV